VSQALLANAAVELDGIELDFYGDQCGQAYRIRRNCTKTWEIYFYDWREGGWYELRGYGGWHTRTQAIEIANQHATEHRLINFLPHRPKFKSTGYCLAAAQAQVASAVTFGFFGLF
jgi:hypothetical protein